MAKNGHVSGAKRRGCPFCAGAIIDASSYGFTQHEVDELLDKVSIRTDRAEIQHWYNGCTFRSEVLYNPWSIMCCLASEGELAHYWLDSGGAQLIDEVLLSDEDIAGSADAHSRG